MDRILQKTDTMCMENKSSQHETGHSGNRNFIERSELSHILRLWTCKKLYFNSDIAT